MYNAINTMLDVSTRLGRPIFHSIWRGKEPHTTIKPSKKIEVAGS